MLGSRGVIPFRLTLSGAGLLLTLFLAYGPTIAALMVTSITTNGAGIRALLGRLLIWRVGWQWYVVAQSVFFAFLILGVVLGLA